ncbi:MAG: biotin--[acetyl-CoA-carboxylase] ligase [Ginsengibacter sp.]
MPIFHEKLILLDSIGSTNNYAMAMVQNNLAESGNAVSARVQTQGKGRRSKQWLASPGENITLSIMVEMQWQPIFQQFQLSAAVALGCYDFLTNYIPSGITIKWPNDLFFNDSKAAGILIENVLKGTLWQWAIIGIGININQMDFSGVQNRATSLQKITGVVYSVDLLTKELHHLVLQRIEMLSQQKFAAIMEEYNHNLYGKNQKVRFKKGAKVFETVIQKIAENGQLITKDSIERSFDFDEIIFKGLV